MLEPTLGPRWRLVWCSLVNVGPDDEVEGLPEGATVPQTYLRSGLVFVEEINGQRAIEVDWSPEGIRSGSFHIVLLRRGPDGSHDWKNPLREIEARDPEGVLNVLAEWTEATGSQAT